MKITLILSAMFMALSGFAQSTTYGSVTLRVSNFETKESQTTVIIAEDVEAFDIPAFIQKHSENNRIYAYGTYTINDEQTSVAFTNKDENNKTIIADAFCEVSEYGLKPFLGVGIEATDDLNGVTVRRILSESVAEQIGLAEGDIIVSVNGEEVISECDLKMVVSQAGIGTEVPVTYKKGGKLHTKYATIGARTIQKVTYVACDKADQDIEEITPQVAAVASTNNVEMTVYPNPTAQGANIRYTSESTAPVTFYVIAMDGSVLESQNYETTAGGLFINYNFIDNTSGTYQMVIEQEGQVHIEHIQVIK
jgi:membrane-associated protease RseP (regulator of RpoE activity)